MFKDGYKQPPLLKKPAISLSLFDIVKDKSPISDHANNTLQNYLFMFSLIGEGFVVSLHPDLVQSAVEAKSPDDCG